MPLCFNFFLTPSATAQVSRIDDLLRAASPPIDPARVGVRREDVSLLIGDPTRSRYVDWLMTEPLRAPDVARTLASNLNNAADQSAARVLQQLSFLNSAPLHRGLTGDPSDKYQKKAEDRGFFFATLRKLNARPEDAARATALPESLQRAAAIILAAQLDATEWIDRSQSISGEDYWDVVEERLRVPMLSGAEEEMWERENADPEYDLEHKRTLERFRPSLPLAAAQDLLYACEAAVKILKADSSLLIWQESIVIRTDFGSIAFGGCGKNQHNPVGPLLLLIDVAGNDVHGRVGANFDRFYPVSVAIDLAGHDVYRVAPDSPGAFGSGLLGVGILWDVLGDDTYEAGRRSMGAGHCGVGVLIDSAGDDAYRSIDASQGWATAGFGLLLDRSGRDRYESVRSSQGSAGPMGAALLLDRDGDDVYTALDSEVLYPSPQSKDHNTSMSQGAGTGWRCDYTDGISVAGGVGVLYDQRGSDQYSCGVFGQGVGYWQGAGLLIDDEGDDRYRGYWYVQGAAAHYAAGVLLDRAGKDEYTATANMAMGAGHDLSVGVLCDDAGDDEYNGCTLAIGASNAAGVGLFIEGGGNDRYRAPRESCLGWVNPSDGYRSMFPAFGIFLDLAGSDTYYGKDAASSTRGEARDGGTWRTGAGTGDATGIGADVK